MFYTAYKSNSYLSTVVQDLFNNTIHSSINNNMLHQYSTQKF